MDIGPEIETHHHHHTGRQWIDVILGVSVVAISIVSLMLAMENGQAMKRLVASNSWPFVNAGISNEDDKGARIMALVLQNKGVGPAKIETLEIFYNGQPMPDARTLLHTMLGPSANGETINYVGSTVVGNVLSAKESLQYLLVNDRTASSSEVTTLSNATNGIKSRTCYCSVFDECWMLDHTITRQSSAATGPKPIKVCPTPRVPFDN